MKGSKWIFLILFNFLFISLNAQVENELLFPITGNFSFNPQVGQQKDFNQVVIESNIFHLKMDNQIVRSYKAVASIKGGFAVEQFYLENQSPSQNIERFNVNISNITENECFFTVSYTQGSEKIHLIRQN
jgi:hypothetical protein